MTRDDLTEKILDIKREKGWSWKHITGSISPNYDQAQLQLGANYSMTAASSIPGFGLQAWTDGTLCCLWNATTI